MIEGLLLVNKPLDWTSFDVVNRLRGLIAQSINVKSRSVKVGHSGTLDPFASGLLIILIGKNYTKKSAELLKYDKTYQVVARLGQKSSTGDTEGKIEDVSTIKPSLSQIKHTLSLFTGQLQQTPPVYSAIKINGQRAYKLARSGDIPQMPVKTVQIYQIELQEYIYPTINFLARVSSGTYVRSLVSDIGDKLNVGAYTQELRRTKIGQYDIKNAIEMENIDFPTICQNLIIL